MKPFDARKELAKEVKQFQKEYGSWEEMLGSYERGRCDARTQYGYRCGRPGVGYFIVLCWQHETFLHDYIRELAWMTALDAKLRERDAKLRGRVS